MKGKTAKETEEYIARKDLTIDEIMLIAEDATEDEIHHEFACIVDLEKAKKLAKIIRSKKKQAARKGRR